jgi:hypothetical protein
VNDCARQARERPPYFSWDLLHCLETLPISAVLDGVSWAHPRKGLEDRVRAVIARRLMHPHDATADDTAGVLRLTRADETVHCRLEVVESLAASPAGRDALGKALDADPVDAFHLMEAIAYLAGARLAAFPQPVTNAYPASEAELSAADVKRVEAARAEILRAYLSIHPLDVLKGIAAWLYQDYDETWQGNAVIRRPVMVQGDRWLCARAQENATIKETGRSARDYVTDRVLRGDLNDGLRLLDACTSARAERGVTINQPPWLFERVRQWLLALRPTDLKDNAMLERAGKLLEYLLDAGGSTMTLQLTHLPIGLGSLRNARDTGLDDFLPRRANVLNRADYPECNELRIDQYYSSADLQLLGLEEPNPPPQQRAPADEWVPPEWRKRKKTPLAEQLRVMKQLVRAVKPVRLDQPVMHMGPRDFPQY